jgi:hypothetical protein
MTVIGANHDVGRIWLPSIRAARSDENHAKHRIACHAGIRSGGRSVLVLH